jgi:uridylate kinase
MEICVIKLGGSLISLDNNNLINYEYLDNLSKILNKFEDKKFAVVVGGGHLCRKYQGIARDNGISKHRDLDWIGIATINLNAEMIRSYWADIADEKIIRYGMFDDLSGLDIEKKILVCAAKEPGHSSDVDAVLIANQFEASTVYRLTDVDGIYDSDPNKNQNAKKFKELSWDKYFEVLGIDEFSPGGHYPIDPVAAQKSKEYDLEFKLMNGNDINQLDKALKENPFEGTVVKSV